MIFWGAHAPRVPVGKPSLALSHPRYGGTSPKKTFPILPFAWTCAPTAAHEAACPPQKRESRVINNLS
ncbi:MAG: hypothetical protein QOI34_1829 [Verrucomicrobiota bacterium]|jgi:hypothetical protein